MATHLNLLTTKLVDLERRRITRLLVELPPRHGKSELCSQYYPAWYLGRHPTHRVTLASYESTFAQLWGEKTRDILAEYGPAVFGTHVHKSRTSASDWRVAQHGGSMRCTGVTGGLTGRGTDLLIIDDPIKDAMEASSSRRPWPEWSSRWWWVERAERWDADVERQAREAFVKAQVEARARHARVAQGTISALSGPVRSGRPSEP